MEEQRKGVILLGGKGSRLYPITQSINKHLLPIYDKPMFFYPLSTLMLSGIRDITFVVNERDLSFFSKYYNDGSALGMNFSYLIQKEPMGIADGLSITRDLVGGSNICLILGDNIFYGGNLSEKLHSASNKKKGATIFGYEVRDPKEFGVLEVSGNKILSIEEKPSKPKSNYAITGLYYFDNEVFEICEKIKPSERGELEITDVINRYFEKEILDFQILGRGFSWLDTGSFDSLRQASNFVSLTQKSQGFPIASLEEIAFRNGWISSDELRERAESGNLNFREYLLSLLDKQ